MKLRTTVVMLVVLVAGFSALGYGVTRASALIGGDDGTLSSSSVPADPASTAPATTAPGTTDTDTATPDPIPSARPTPSATPTPKPRPKPTPTLEAGPTLLGVGQDGDRVRDLQARLKQIGWFSADVTGYYGDTTAASVRGFQAKREIPQTGAVDQRTLDRLNAMTRTPTDDELHNVAAQPAAGPLDPRCRVGRVLCIDKSTRTLRWVVDGAVRTTLDVRFGSEMTPTREGRFAITYKNRDHVSSLYGSSMPFAMFFSRGQAVHYSSDFAARGYDGASHGCVNVRDYDALAALYDQVSVGDGVVVYWS